MYVSSYAYSETSSNILISQTFLYLQTIAVYPFLELHFNYLEMVKQNIS